MKKNHDLTILGFAIVAIALIVAGLLASEGRVTLSLCVLLIAVIGGYIFYKGITAPINVLLPFVLLLGTSSCSPKIYQQKYTQIRFEYTDHNIYLLSLLVTGKITEDEYQCLKKLNENTYQVKLLSIGKETNK